MDDERELEAELARCDSEVARLAETPGHFPEHEARIEQQRAEILDRLAHLHDAA